MASSLSCRTCLVALDSKEVQRVHARTDWHAYNLKRRIADLSPISEQVFLDQVKAGQKAANDLENPVSFRQSCSMCQKSYHSSEAYQNHLLSKKHIQNAARAPAQARTIQQPEVQKAATVSERNASVASDDDDEDELEDEEEPDEEDDEELDDEKDPVNASRAESPEFDPLACLFCAHAAATLDANTAHMQRRHGFFIPNQHLLTDLATFLGYLATVVGVFHECLYCARVKGSARAARQHMLDKGHCRIGFDDEAAAAAFDDFYDDDAPESDEADGAVAFMAAAQHEKPSSFAAAAAAAAASDGLMHLPSGRTLGNRSHAQPKKRRAHPAASAAAADQAESSGGSGSAPNDAPPSQQLVPATGHQVPRNQRNAGHSRQLVSRANGGLGMLGVSELDKRSVRALEKKTMALELRARKQYEGLVEKSMNKTGQKHFKPDVPGRLNG